MIIIFDFDGVILNSHKVKTEAFYDVCKYYGNNIGIKAKNFHKKHIGKSRYFKFKFIFKKILKKKININELSLLDNKFDCFIKKKIKKKEPSKNLLKFLKNNYKFHDFYISTGTPQNKIKKILKEKKLISYFKKVYGSPKSKLEHIDLIKKKNKKVLFIGDSYEDFEVSRKKKINFLLKINSENMSFRKKIITKKINSFKYLDHYIKSQNFK